MPLSNLDLSNIAKEYASSNDKLTSYKSSIQNINDEIVKTQSQADDIFILYRNANDERVVPYQMEKRWLDGTTYTDITEQQIQDGGTRTTGNIFFPTSWTLSNAKLVASGNGNPTTISLNSESSVLTSTTGLSFLVNLIKNGQSAGVASDTLNSSYVPGASTINVTHTGHTNGHVLYIAGSGTSAAVLITGVSGTVLTITEIVPPASTIGTVGSSVIENIAGFTNTERQTLTSGSFQNVLTGLASDIAVTAGLWNTALSNQLTQLKINIDNPSQITSTKTNVTTAQTAYSTWNALFSTGINGKYVDINLANLTSAYTTRISNLSTREAQIVTALGTVTQDGQGNYSGNGLYLQRYKCLNFLINTANGPLFLLGSLNVAKLTFQQKVTNEVDKLATFTNVVKYTALSADSAGTMSIIVDSASQFAISDAVVLTGTDLPSIGANITGITGSTVTLDQVVPKAFSKAAKAAIIKRS